MNKQKIIFYGSTIFSKIVLESLINNEDYQIIAVVTQPDKPFGRKRLITPSIIKVLAQENDIKVLTPVRLNDSFKTELEGLDADLGIVAAYGKILPDFVLDHPRLKCINIHGSILPVYRGATPVQCAIRDGLQKTGISIIRMVPEMDAGNILATASAKIESTDNVENLMRRLAESGAESLRGLLPKLFSEDPIHETVQNADQATYCFVKDFSFENGQIDWNRDAKNISNHIRAFSPQPRAWTIYKSKKLFILEADFVEDGEINKSKEGEIIESNGELVVECLIGKLKIKQLQIEGKGIMDYKSFLNGYKKDLPASLGNI